ncbi:MAG: 7-cyano-7-deazaguanine synthase QueC [Acidobacteria bacterium]|nr:7-cyano-7-deazaguanine synthase QueC [Acidobacteriota bacterium]
MRSKGIVLLSGGMDSCVTAAVAAKECEVAALHVSYGQLTEARERRAFEEVTDYFGISERLLVDQSYLGRMGGSALTDSRIPLREADPSAPLPSTALETGRAGLEARDIPASYVPFRNAHFLAVAVSWAEVIGAQKIYIGAVEQDSSGYPDCRPEYYRIFNELIGVGTRPETRIEIVTPLIHLKKSEIVKKGIELRAPFHLSWSCYRNCNIACGRCDSCVLRQRAFTEAGVEDLIPYEEQGRFSSRRAI